MADIARQGDQEVNIVDKTTQVSVGVTSEKRLQVIAQLESGSGEPVFGLQFFIPYMTYNASGISIDSSSFTSLLSVNGEQGKLSFIAISGLKSNYRVRVDIDSTTVYDISMAELSAIGLANATNVDIWAEKANKNFRYHPNEPVDFNNSVDIYAKSTGSTMTVYYLITHSIAGGD